MYNVDTINNTKTELLNNLANAIREQDTEKMKASMEAWQNYSLEIFENAKREFEETSDKTILAARGVRQLTAEETKYFTNFIEYARNEGVINGVMDVLPTTTITNVLDDIRQSHPLLDAINFQSTGASISWVVNNQGTQMATWDELNTEIVKKLTGEITTMDMTLCKLSAYMFCTQDMLDLGPTWIEAYIRQTMAEALAVGLETGIVDGTGLKEPTGMTRDFKGSLNQSTGFARKEAIALNDFSPKSYGAVLEQLTKTPLGNRRAVSSVIFICNPADYFTKVMPATTVRTLDSYVNNVFPFPTQVIQSVGCPEGHAVIGIAKNYFMGLGTSRGGKLEKSDEYKFLEDLRTYKIKLHGNGRAVDINSFMYLDISNLDETYMTVNFKNISGTASTEEG